MSDNSGIKCSCNGGGELNLIFSCSGAADVGEITDKAARQLSSEGNGSMFCLAGIGGNVSGIVASTRAADKILAIDGCKLDCAAKCLENAGFSGYEHLRLTDLGMRKGESPLSSELVLAAVKNAEKLLN